jgi:hypothetical protein
MAWPNNELEAGSFKVKIKEREFEPGDPLQQNRTAMGMQLGKNLMVLYYDHDEVTEFSVVDERTGDVIRVEVRNWTKEFEELWKQINIADVADALENGRKIEAIKTIRRDTLCDLKTAKMLIDSQWIWDRIHALRHTAPKAVDNGDGTGSLKGKLTGMGF